MTPWEDRQAELRSELTRLVTASRDAIGEVSHKASAVDLYRDAAHAAERGIPGPLGVALAGVLVKASYERSLNRMPGCLGAETTMLSLAVAVMLAADAEGPA